MVAGPGGARTPHHLPQASSSCMCHLCSLMLSSGHLPQDKEPELQLSSLALMEKLIELQREVDESSIRAENFTSALKALLCH